MIRIRRSEDRGPTRLGWLDSRHTFSFGEYYDPAHMGISVLRVINEDRVVPGGGFATHSHRDMEILSYVLQGVIEHKDSMGNIERLPAGEFQLMSAGTGVTHSEYNPSATEPLRFLQIWIRPDRAGIAPGYQQKRFPQHEGRRMVVSPDGRDGSLRVHQDASVEHLRLPAGTDIDLPGIQGRLHYLHVIAGRLEIGEDDLAAGDGATIAGTDASLRATTEVEALLFNLPE